ncbi:MAG: RecQ family ATP-dependent DNA helicase [Flavobacteriaceae bacterium]|nr:RecQ family ATP-dependent DNA helicase [Flavobacteriaceae bacterium]
MQKPKDYLVHYFNHKSFRAPQETIIQSVLEKRDTVALLPTGGGKSLCYQIPALMRPGTCLVISPLIALMKDQVIGLKLKGIKAEYLRSKFTQDDIIRLFDNCKYGEVKFLYLSPERLQSDFIQQKIKELTINIVAVDEAHCVSEWGHDFRPAYLKIALLKKLLPNVPFLALSATATPLVLKDIKQHLELNKPKCYSKSFYRPNISYQIIEAEDKNTKLLLLLKKHSGSCIIYTNTRRLTKEISKFLNAHKLKSCYYHGGLNLEEKDKAYLNWMDEKTPIIVATNAFGMGIDKDNVQIIIHHNLPSSLENYMQETGRSGRNNRAAYAFLLYNHADINYLKTQFKNSTPSVKQISEVYNKLCQYFQIAYGELNDSWFDFDLVDFSKRYSLEVLLAYNAVKTFDREGIISLNSDFFKRTEIQFIASNNQVLRYAETHKELGHLIKTILRNYGGLFEHKSAINLSVIASKTGMRKQSVLRHLKTLENEAIIDLKSSDGTSQLQFLQPREDNITINKIAERISNYNLHKEEKLESVIAFVKNDTVCRNKQLLHYFGEIFPKNCHTCDVCISSKNTTSTVNYKDISKAILLLLKTGKSLNSKAIVLQIDFEEKHVLHTLQLLLDNHKIIVNSQHKFIINN